MIARLALGLISALLLAMPAFAQGQTVVVTKRVIYPGETVDLGSLMEVPVRNGVRNLSAMAIMPEQVDGMVARRTLLPGRFIPLSSVREAYVVEAGKPVAISFVHGPLVISTTGVPLQPGAAGDTVRVRNLDSGTVVSGTVLADGTIRIGTI